MHGFPVLRSVLPSHHSWLALSRGGQSHSLARLHPVCTASSPRFCPLVVPKIRKSSPEPVVT